MLNTKIGSLNEEQACKFLLTQGFEILTQNYKALPYGEIDIIALDETVLAFIEVKYRKKTQFATAEETLTYSKQNKLIKAASIFLSENTQYQNHECRFDIVAINNNNINWIKNAFGTN